MKALSDSEVDSWGKAVGVSLKDWRTLCFTDATGGTFEFDVPETPAQIIAFVIATTATDDELGISSSSHLLWLKDWDIWSDDVEAIGRKSLSCLRSTFGELRPLLGTSGHLFSASERVDLQTFLLQPFFFGWDAYIVPSSGEYIFEVSHDSWIRVTGRSAEMTEALFRRYLPWHPRWVVPVAVLTSSGAANPDEVM